MRLRNRSGPKSHRKTVALYLAALSLVSLVGAYLAVETYRSDIYGERPRGREAIVEG